MHVRKQADGIDPTAADNRFLQAFPDLLQQLPNPVVILKGNAFLIELANDHLLKVWGKRPEDVLGRPYFEVQPQNRAAGVEALFQQVYQTGQSVIRPEVAATYIHEGKRVDEVHKVILSPLRNQLGEIEGIFAVGYDITSEIEARRAQAESQSFVNAVLESNPDCVKVLNEAGRLTYMNTHGLCLMEIDDFSQVEGQLWWELWPVDYREQVQAAVEQALAGSTARFQAFCPSVKGTPRWWDVIVTPVRNDRERHIISTSRDITEQKQSELRLQEVQEYFRNTFDNAAVGIAHVAPDGNWLLVNDRMCAIVGYTRAELQACTFQDITHPDDMYLDLELVKAVVDGRQQSFSLEKRYLHKDGHIVWVNLTVSLVRKPDGQPHYFISIIEDISLRKAAEEKSQDSESRFRNLSDQVPAMIWVTDSEGYCHYLNKQWYDFTGQTVEESLGLGWTNAVHPDERELAAHSFITASRQATSYKIEFRLRKWDGTYEWVIDSAEPRFGDDRTFLGFIGSVVNIHYRKVAEEELKKVHLHLDLATTAAGVGTWSLHLATGVVEWSSLHNQMWGYDETFGNLTYEDWFRVILPEDRERALEVVERARISRSKYENEYRIQRADTGAIRWIRSFGQFIYNQQDEAETLTGISIDITAQKEIEAALQQSEARYRSLAGELEVLVEQRTKELTRSQNFLQSVLETTQNGIVTYVPVLDEADRIVDFRIAYINSMLTRVMGLNPTDITGKTMREVFPQDVADGTFAHLVAFIETGEGSYHEFERTYQGVAHFYEASLARMGKGVTLTIIDTTAQRKATQKLQEVNRDLQRSNEDLQQFAHVASHDLKEPVRKVLTFHGRLLNEFEAELPQQALLYLSRIEVAARRSFDMIEGLLHYAKVDTTEQTHEPVDLTRVLKHIETDLDVIIQQKGGVIQCNALPVVEGAPTLIYQLFYNLLINALKFSQPGRKPRIQVWAEKTQSVSEAGNAFVSIFVQDNGIGFDQEYAERIFQTYARLHSKDQYEGSGLGLALCRRIVERHGGTIRAEGRKGEGACFIVTLPVSLHCMTDGPGANQA